MATIDQISYDITGSSTVASIADIIFSENHAFEGIAGDRKIRLSRRKVYVYTECLKMMLSLSKTNKHYDNSLVATIVTVDAIFT